MNDIDNLGDISEKFLHIRIITGVVVSLCISRLLGAFVIFIQHPKRRKANGFQITWISSLMLWIVSWWWSIFNMKDEIYFDYFVYIVLLSYAFVYFFIVFLLTPDDIHEYPSFLDYFIAVHKVFYFLCILISTEVIVIDVYFGGADGMHRSILYGSFLLSISIYMPAMLSGSHRFQFFISLCVLFLAVLGVLLDLGVAIMQERAIPS